MKLVLVSYSGISLGFFLGGAGGHLLVPLLVLSVPLMMRINGAEHCSDVNQQWATQVSFGTDNRPW
jgi:hypothetical protein